MTVPATRTTRTLLLDDIHPYPGNPRHIPQSAVDEVAFSIKTYGYKQPIVVDDENVIVVGHTRLKALRQLGVERAEVWVADDLSPEKIAAYRLVDNRTSEMGQWDNPALLVELREWEQSLLDRFFPDIELEIAQITDSQVTDEDIAQANDAIGDVRKREDEFSTTAVECPSCHGQFPVRTDSLFRSDGGRGAE
jgi:disulfide oxidoreductase YuzD